MSKVIKMGVAAAITAAKDQNIQGIVVGSGAGCCHNTVLFIGEYNERQEEILSPHSFIQSTDNTIAGQIALILQNFSYNITYIQKGLAFENALVDAVLLSEENNAGILIGGVDEWIPLFELGETTKALHPEYWIGEGAGFFILSQAKQNALALISACGILQSKPDSIENELHSFLDEHQLEIPDLILYGNSFVNEVSIDIDLLNVKTVHYSDICGIYFTNTAFGMNLGTEILTHPSLAKENGFNAKRILIVNNFNDADWGVIYLSALS